MLEPVDIVYYVPAGRNFELRYSKLPELQASIQQLAAALPAGWTVDVTETLNESVLNSISLSSNDNLASVLGQNGIRSENVRYPEDHVFKLNGQPLLRVRLRIGVQRKLIYNQEQVRVDPLPVISGSQRMLWVRMTPRFSTANAYARVLEQLEQVRASIITEFARPTEPGANATAQEKFAYRKTAAQVGRDRLGAVINRALPLLGGLLPPATRIRLLQRLLFGRDGLADEAQLVAVADLSTAQAVALHPLLLARGQLTKRLRLLGESLVVGSGRTYSLLLRLELNAKAGPPDREFEVLFGGFTNTSTVDVGPDPGMSGVLLVFQQGRWRDGYEYMQDQPAGVPFDEQLSLRGVFSFANTSPHVKLRLPFSYESVPVIPQSELAGAQLNRRTAIGLEAVLPENVRQQPEFSGNYIYASANPVKLELLVPAETVVPGVKAAAPIDALSAAYLAFYTQPFSLKVKTEEQFAVSHANASITLNARRFFPNLRPSFSFVWSGPQLDNVKTDGPQLGVGPIRDEDTGVYIMRFTDSATGYSRTFTLSLEIEAFCKRCRTAYKGSKNWFGACSWHSQHNAEVMARLQAGTVTLRSLLVKEFPERWLREPVLRLLDDLRDRSFLETKAAELYSRHEARLEDVRCLIVLSPRSELLTLEELEKETPRPELLTLDNPASGLFDSRRDAQPDRLLDAANSEGPRNPNLLSGHGPDSLRHTVNLCCRRSDAGGCWSGVHNPSTAVPDLHDWLLVRQRGTQHLNSQYATARQHELIEAALGETELLLEREEWFNTVHGGELKPQFSYRDQRLGETALESVLNHPGVRVDEGFGEKLRLLYDQVDLEFPFRCWSRNELFAQLYDERSVALPTYSGNRRTRAVQLIKLFADLRLERVPRLRIQKLDVWLERNAGLKRRLQNFRAPTQIVKGAIDELTKLFNDQISGYKGPDAEFRKAEEKFSKLEKSLSEAEITHEAHGVLEASLAALKNLRSNASQWVNVFAGLETDRDELINLVTDFGYTIPPPSDTEWEKATLKVLRKFKKAFTTGNADYPAGGYALYGQEVKKFASALNNSTLSADISKAVGELAVAKAAYQSALDSKIAEYRDYLSKLKTVLSLSDEMWIELAVVRILREPKQKTRFSAMNAHLNDPNLLRESILIAAKADLQQIHTLTQIEEQTQRLRDYSTKSNKGDLGLENQLTTHSIEAASLLRYRVFELLNVKIWFADAEAVLDQYTNDETFRPSPNILKLAKKMGIVTMLDGSSASALPSVTMGQLYDAFIAVLRASSALQPLPGQSIPYRTLADALLGRKPDQEQALASQGEEIYKTLSSDDEKASFFLSVTLNLESANLRASDYGTDAASLKAFLTTLRFIYSDAGVNRENVGRLKETLDFLGGGNGPKPAGLTQAEETVRQRGEQPDTYEEDYPDEDSYDQDYEGPDLSQLGDDDEGAAQAEEENRRRAEQERARLAEEETRLRAAEEKAAAEQQEEATRRADELRRKEASGSETPVAKPSPEEILRHTALTDGIKSIRPVLLYERAKESAEKGEAAYAIIKIVTIQDYTAEKALEMFTGQRNLIEKIDPKFFQDYNYFGKSVMWRLNNLYTALLRKNSSRFDRLRELLTPILNDLPEIGQITKWIRDNFVKDGPKTSKDAVDSVTRQSGLDMTRGTKAFLDWWVGFSGIAMDVWDDEMAGFDDIETGLTERLTKIYSQWFAGLSRSEQEKAERKLANGEPIKGHSVVVDPEERRLKAEQEKARLAKEEEERREEARLKQLAERASPDAPVSIRIIERPFLPELIDSLENLTTAKLDQVPNKNLEVENLAKAISADRLRKIVEAVGKTDLFNRDINSWFRPDDRPSMPAQAYVDALEAINSPKSVLYAGLIDWILRTLDTAYAFNNGEPVLEQYLSVDSNPATPVKGASPLETVVRFYLRDNNYKLTQTARAYDYPAYVRSANSKSGSRFSQALTRGIGIAVAAAVIQGLPLLDPVASRNKELPRACESELQAIAGHVQRYYDKNPEERQFALSFIRRTGLKFGYSQVIRRDSVRENLLNLLKAHFALASFGYPEPALNAEGLLGGLSIAIHEWGPSPPDSAMSLAIGLVHGADSATLRNQLVVDNLWTVATALPGTNYTVLEGDALTQAALGQVKGRQSIEDGAKDLAQFSDTEPRRLLFKSPRSRFLFQDKERAIILLEALPDGGGYNAYNANTGAKGPVRTLDSLTNGSILLQSTPSISLADDLGSYKWISREQDAQRDRLEDLRAWVDEFYAKLSVGTSTPGTVAATVQESLWLVFRDTWSQLIQDMQNVNPNSRLVPEMQRALSRESVDTLVANQLGTFEKSSKEQSLFEWIVLSLQTRLSQLNQKRLGEPLVELAAALKTLDAPSSYKLDVSKFYRILYSECNEFLRELTVNYTSARDFYVYLLRREAGFNIRKEDRERAIERLKRDAGNLWTPAYAVTEEELGRALRETRIQTVDYDALDQVVLRGVKTPDNSIGARIKTPSAWSALSRELGVKASQIGSEALYEKAVELFLKKRWRSTTDQADIATYTKEVRGRLIPLAEKTARRLADYINRSGRTGTADQLFCYVAELFALQQAFYGVEPPKSGILRLYLVGNLATTFDLDKVALAMTDLGAYLNEKSAYIRSLYERLDNALFSNSDAYDGASASYRRSGAPHTLSMVNGRLKISYKAELDLDLKELRFFKVGLAPFDKMSEHVEMLVNSGSPLVSDIKHDKIDWVTRHKSEQPRYTPASPGIIATNSEQIDVIEAMCTKLEISLVSSRLDYSRVVKKIQSLDDEWLKRVQDLMYWPYNVKSNLSLLKKILPREPTIVHPPVTVLDDPVSLQAARKVIFNADNQRDMGQFYEEWDINLTELEQDNPKWKEEAQNRYNQLPDDEKALFATQPKDWKEMNFETGDLGEMLYLEFSRVFGSKSKPGDLVSDFKDLSESIARGVAYQPAAAHTSLAAVFADANVRAIGANLNPESNVFSEYLYMALDNAKNPIAFSIWQTDANVMELNYPGFSSDNRDPSAAKLDAFVPLEVHGPRPDVGHLLMAVAMLDARFCDGKSACYRAVRKSVGMERVAESPAQPTIYYAADLNETVFSLLSRFRPTFSVTSEYDKSPSMQNPLSNPQERPFFAQKGYGIELDSVAGYGLVRGLEDQPTPELVSRNQLLPLAIHEDRDQPSPNKLDLSVQMPTGKWTVFTAPVGKGSTVSRIGAPIDNLPSAAIENSIRYEKLRELIVGLDTEKRRKFEASKGWIEDLNDVEGDNSIAYFWAAGRSDFVGRVPIDSNWDFIFTADWLRQFYAAKFYANDRSNTARANSVLEGLKALLPGDIEPPGALSGPATQQRAALALDGWKKNFLVPALDNYMRMYYESQPDEEQPEGGEEELEEEISEEDAAEEEEEGEEREQEEEQEQGEDEEEEVDTDEVSTEEERRKLAPRSTASTNYALGYEYFPRRSTVTIPVTPAGPTALARRYPFLTYCAVMDEETVALNVILATPQHNKIPRNSMIRQPIGSPARSKVARFCVNIPE